MEMSTPERARQPVMSAGQRIRLYPSLACELVDVAPFGDATQRVRLGGSGEIGKAHV